MAVQRLQAAVTGNQLQGSTFNPQLVGSGTRLQVTSNPQQSRIVSPNFTNTANPMDYGSGTSIGTVAGASTNSPNTQPAPDPWANTPWGSKAAYTTALNDYSRTRDITMGSINDAMQQSGNEYHSGILDFLDSYKMGQKSIDNKAVKSEMQREQGRMGVLDMVGTGIRSGNVMLNNKNASSSSAAEAIARAYGTLGEKQMRQVGNEYSLRGEDIKQDQEALSMSLDTFRRKSKEAQTSTINSLVSDATSRLAQLDSLAASSSLPDRINIESEKARIRQETLNILTQYDSVLTDGVSKSKAKTTAENRAEAQRLMTSGMDPQMAASFGTSIPLYVGA